MKKIIRWQTLIFIFLASSFAYAQQSENTVTYQVTYEPSTKKYTVFVVPDYSVPGPNNSLSTEKGATAQVTLAIPKDFIIANITDVRGSWEKAPVKLGPGQPGQDWSGSGLDVNTNYYVIGKSSDETDYGPFQTDVAVELFTFEGNDCFGPVRIINPDEPFINAADARFNLNVANSFYSRSGQPQGGNQNPLEQFRDVSGNPADCTPTVTAVDDTNPPSPPDTPVITSVLANDSRNDDPVTIADVNLTVTVTPTKGTTTVNSDGTITYTPNPGTSGEDTYTYKICDKVQTDVCSEAIVTVTIQAPVDNREIFAFNDNNVTNIDKPVSGNVLTNDLLNNGTPNLVVTTTPTMMPSNGSVILNSNGTYTYTPATGFVGTDVFKYQVCDSGVPKVCDEASVSIEVRDNTINQNLPPIALGDNNITKSGVPVDGDVSVNDIDPDGGTLTFTLVTPPANGILTLNTDGTYTYTSTNNFVGTDTFVYRTCDDGNPTLCDEAIVHIEVYDFAVNNTPPIANDDIYLRLPNQNVTGNILTNDSDLDDGPLVATTTPVIPPAKGTVTINSNGDIEYVPGANYDGFDTFVYEVCNSNIQFKECAQATVFILENILNIPEETDLTITKIADSPSASLNDIVTFSIGVTNNGAITATNIRIKDELPAGLRYISGAESESAGAYFWDITSLAPGETRTFEIKAQVITLGVSTNTASIDSFDQTDSDPSDNTASACVSVPIVLCQGERLELSVPSSYTDVQWYKDGVFFASGNSVLVTESGTYTNQSPDNNCPTNNCCPIVVVTQVCCPEEICIPITIKKVR